MGSLRIGHDWATSLSLFTFMHWKRKWHPTPVFLPGKSQGWRSLMGCRLWGRRVGHDWCESAAAAVCTSRVSCQQPCTVFICLPTPHSWLFPVCHHWDLSSASGGCFMQEMALGGRQNPLVLAVLIPQPPDSSVRLRTSQTLTLKV